MIRRCDDCGKVYDDEPCWTICPHGPHSHGLMNYCPKCDATWIGPPGVCPICEFNVEEEVTRRKTEWADTPKTSDTANRESSGSPLY